LKESYLEQICKNQIKLYGYLNSLHPYRDEVPDILQDANITLINKQEEFDDKKDFLPWAFSIVKFTLMAHRQKRAREMKKLTCDSNLMNVLLDFKSTSLREDLLYEVKAEQRKLLSLIRKRLTLSQKRLLDDLLDGKGIEEISKEWGSRYGAIQTQKHRLLKKMRSVLLQIKLSRKYDYSD
jgi:RNA polymerase sigma factor (sigma-70 family)